MTAHGGYRLGMTGDFLEWFFIQGKLQGAGWDRSWMVLEGERHTGLRIHSSLSVLVADGRSLSPKDTQEETLQEH